MTLAHPIRCATLLGLAACLAQAPTQVTDQLTAREIGAISEMLRNRGLLGDTRVLTYLALHESSKQDLATASTVAATRQVEVQLLDRSSGSVRDLTIDIAGMSVVSEQRRDGAVPRLSSMDARQGARLLTSDSVWLSALRRRGLGPNEVAAHMMGPGVLGLGWEVTGHRYARMIPYLTAERNNVSAPVEGIVGIVDLTAGTVVAVTDAEREPPPIDRSPVPIFPDEPELKRSLSVQQRRHNYRVDGSSISWAGWTFGFAMDPRVGLVLHDVAFGPSGQRPHRILSRAALSEMLVPYGDPSSAWSFRSIFDAGEFGIGRTAATLIPGQDLPDNAERFDAVMASDAGLPRHLRGVIGLYERDGGLRWRHGEQARRSRELVLRSATTVGNYDYGFSWVFSQDGVIAMEVDLTGQMLVKGVSHTDPRFGTSVAPHLSAILHQHFFNFRLDVDVGGQRNRVREVETTSLPVDATNSQGTAFAIRSTVLGREGKAVRDAAPALSRMWVVENPHLKDSLGQSPGYELHAGPLPALLAAPQSMLSKRGAFATHALWVTAWKGDERFAAGEFPGQDPGGAGLPSFIADDEAIDDADIVVWYTMGVNHLPRPEEWPLMPVSRIRFELRPRHFLTMTSTTGTGK